MESKGYIDLTLSALRDFGIEIINNDYKEFIIKGNQEYQKNVLICLLRILINGECRMTMLYPCQKTRFCTYIHTGLYIRTSLCVCM